MPWQFERQAERLDAIGPILATVRNSAMRTAAFAVAQPRIMRGEFIFYAEKALREWVALYDIVGPGARMPRSLTKSFAA